MFYATRLLNAPMTQFLGYSMFRTIILLLLLTPIVSFAARTKYYKWTDENGNVQYTQKAPKSGEVKTIEIDSYEDKKTNGKNGKKKDKLHAYMKSSSLSKTWKMEKKFLMVK